MITDYLFTDEIDTRGMLSVSQLQTYLSCKKKWEYAYIDNLTPRIERPFFTIGRLCHIGMQTAMQTLWKNGNTPCTNMLLYGLDAIKSEYERYICEVPMHDEEIPEFEETFKKANSVFEQALYEFEPYKYEVYTIRGENPRPALELHFRVPCEHAKAFHGFIDAILREKDTGFLWCVDYKFRKTLAPDEDENFNIQNAVYAYACQMMEIPITGTMTWQHINTPAADPSILKDGKISRAKIKTTWEHYAEFCREHGEDPDTYEEEMREKLSDIEWFRKTLEYRNGDTLRIIWSECVLPVAAEMFSMYDVELYRSLYPWNCKMCQFQSLCQAELRDYDTEAIKQREYVVRGKNGIDNSKSAMLESEEEGDNE